MNALRTSFVSILFNLGSDQSPNVWMKAALAKCAAEGQTEKVSQGDQTKRPINLAMPTKEFRRVVSPYVYYTMDVFIAML